MTEESIEKKALQRCYALLVAGLQNPEGVAEELFSISKLTFDELTVIQSLTIKKTKAQELINTLMQRVINQPSELDYFLTILKKETVNNVLVRKLEAAVRELKQERNGEL